MVSGEGVRQARELGDRDRLRELFANGATRPHRLDGRATRHVVIEDDEDQPALSDGRWLIYGVLAALLWIAALWKAGAL